MSSAYLPVRLPSLSDVSSSVLLAVGAARRSPPTPTSSGSADGALERGVGGQRAQALERVDVQRLRDDRPAGLVLALRDRLLRDRAEVLAANRT